jgi:hypothetical protein
MSISFRTAAAVAASALLVALNAHTMASAQQAAQPVPPPAAPQGPFAPEKFKNIQVLKDLPADQLDGVMRFMSASLGVKCEFCHVTSEQGNWPMEKDDKKNKQIARTMIQMTNTINAQSFEGKPTVNCASCHHGRNEPDRLPPLAVELTPDQIAALAARAQAQQASAPAARANTPPASGAPGGRGGFQRPTETIDQVLDAYVQALGGRAALEKVASRVMRGTVTDRAGQKSPIVVEEKAPAMVRRSLDSKPAASTFASDGTTYWAQEGTSSWAVTNVFELQEGARLAELTLPLQFKSRYQNLSVARYAKLDGKDMIIVNGRSAPAVVEQFYFDKQSGLLVRRVVSTRTAFGILPEQIDYSDYRVVNGVKVPFQVRHATWESVNTSKFDDVKINVPVDDARFAKPAGSGN